MNIEPSKVNQAQNTISSTQQPKTSENNIKFSEELKELEKQSTSNKEEEIGVEQSANNEQEKEQYTKQNNTENQVNNAIEDLSFIVKKFNQSEEKEGENIKKNDKFVDNNPVINNDFNIQDNKDLLPQMNPNMNFGGNGQPFSSFMNNDSANQQNKLSNNSTDLAEESAILSTMAENIAIANKNNLQSQRIIHDNQGVKKVDEKTSITIENIIKYDSIIMNQADVEVFANLAESKEINLNEITSKATEKSIQVSKTLADLLAKSMSNNQPIRIDFDNNISVIIKISRDGKISADFLPSSQVAEAYLKENLPLLKQRFDENNIKYDELNQRERKDNNKERQQKERSQR